MTLLSVPHNNNAPIADMPLWRIPVKRYHEMIAQGTLTEDDQIELLEGYLVEKMTIKPSHAVITNRIFRMFLSLVPDGYYVGTQQPITTEDSEPEPDAFVVRGKDIDFTARHPVASEVLLLIEVSDSTLLRDQTVKKRIYARAGIPVYWIVNIPERQIEVYSQPSGPTANPIYRRLYTYTVSDRVLVQIEDNEVGNIAAADLFPQELE